MNYNDLTHAELISLIKTQQEIIAHLQTDHAFGIMNRAAAFNTYAHLTNKYLIMIDIANMHALNHSYGMHAVDAKIKSVLATLRKTDVYRHGGDEICLLIDDTIDIDALLTRLDESMQDNDLYAVYGIYHAIDCTLEHATMRVDTCIMFWKRILESSGEKPERNETYVRLQSDFIYC